MAAQCFGVISLATGVSTAMAQSGKMPDPADPGTAIPAVKYESAFSGYQPFREQKIRSWKDANQEVADNPGMGSMGAMGGMKDMPGMDSKAGNAAGHNMGSMKDMPGMGSTGSMKNMPGMDSKPGNAAKSNQGTAGHDMGSKKDMPGMGSTGSMKDMPGMDSKAGNRPKGKEGAAGHDMASMKEMPGMNKEAPSASMSKGGHGAMAMANPSSASRTGEAASITGTAVVQGIDTANGKVRLTHDPIEALGWPKMTMIFRLKDNSLAGPLKEGDRVDFTLEKSAAGYVISSFQKAASRH